ncbi:hypothetical protein FD11_GL002113 [Ligilactobacillus pobuzihii E100301 = KCTC 13174]|uniref:Uncharacterized protein n=1 Tax=Ligilactobacillus pobuzihii TaxID=449659 RepID=A0A0R2L8Q2_9LACO|nr:hypothetical protein FD11_GL002113 [Ligilactobacillus pobuzihii E100301 = KCTC 13174]KRN98185.1 hypothetical protein IV66_GL002125 [Ligilactobacillus pobuzihii]
MYHLVRQCKSHKQTSEVIIFWLSGSQTACFYKTEKIVVQKTKRTVFAVYIK